MDEQVSFTVDGMTIYATYRHPVSSARGPAALLIAGSGIPDRNGDSPGSPEGSIRLLANQLALDGVATLRYDKLGSGRTGLGTFAADPASVRVATYEHEAAATLRFLASRPRSDASQLSVFGHSEGGFYALMMATGHAGVVPHIARLGLIEPLSRRTLDVLDEQVTGLLRRDVSAGRITSAAAATQEQQLTAAITAVRAGRTPAQIPAVAATTFSPNNIGYTADLDRYDPAQLAAGLPAGTSVLLTCSPQDSQVPCSDVDHLKSGLTKAGVSLDYAPITDMDHALKTDDTPDNDNDDAAVPMAPALARAIATFVK